MTYPKSSIRFGEIHGDFIFYVFEKTSESYWMNELQLLSLSVSIFSETAVPHDPYSNCLYILFEI